MSTEFFTLTTLLPTFDSIRELDVLSSLLHIFDVSSLSEPFVILMSLETLVFEVLDPSKLMFDKSS